ncbi:MAG TPA: ABC transporter permease subunit [Acidimicrobiia bacterium]|jgi:ABC-type Na+ efflux pump permease subunit
MNWRSIFAIVRRDLTVVARAKAVMIPLVVVPVILFVGLPLLVSFAIDAAGSDIEDLLPLIEALPERIRASLGDGSLLEQAQVYLLEYQFATFFLIVPLMVCSVIAADSFAGEKERKTLEALLYTPTTDRELYLAKLLGPWLAAITVTVASYGLYLVVCNVALAATIGRPVALTPLWVVVVLWLSPGMAALGLSVLVIVSARVRGFQEAYQVGGVLVLPIVALVAAQFAGLLFVDTAFAILLGSLTWAVAVAVMAVGFGRFRRERLLEQV